MQGNKTGVVLFIWSKDQPEFAIDIQGQSPCKLTHLMDIGEHGRELKHVARRQAAVPRIMAPAVGNTITYVLGYLRQIA